MVKFSFCCCCKDAMCKKITISNGLCWSPDNKFMYYIDSPTRRVDRFSFDAETGHISNRSRFYLFEEEEGYPDGKNKHVYPLDEILLFKFRGENV